MLQPRVLHFGSEDTVFVFMQITGFGFNYSLITPDV